MSRYVQPSLKNSKNSLLKQLDYDLGGVKTLYKLLSNPSHPTNSRRTPEQCENLINVQCLKERISFYESMIQAVKDFKYQEEN